MTKRRLFLLTVAAVAVLAFVVREEFRTVYDGVRLLIEVDGIQLGE